MIFRRPELEKDNPIAPEPYVGPRRRLALARSAASGEISEKHDLKKSLQDLTLAASRCVDHVPKTRKTGKSLQMLRNAIAQAERVLEAERVTGTRSSVGETKDRDPCIG